MKLIPAEEKTKGSGKYKGFKVTGAQVRDIAQRKLQDLNARDLDHAVPGEVAASASYV